MSFWFLVTLSERVATVPDMFSIFSFVFLKFSLIQEKCESMYRFILSNRSSSLLVPVAPPDPGLPCVGEVSIGLPELILLVLDLVVMGDGSTPPRALRFFCPDLPSSSLRGGAGSVVPVLFAVSALA